MIASTRGRSPATRRGVKAFVTSLRSRVWFGGSVLSMCTDRYPVTSSGTQSGDVSLPAQSLCSRASASAARTSAYLVTIQARSPCGSTTGVTGPSSRIRPK